MKILFWTSFVLATGVYAVMVFWSLPALQHAAGGAVPFDLRPTGYSAAQAQAFLRALPQADKTFYLDVQQRLDSVYPALLAVTLGLGAYLLSPASWGLWRLTGAVFAVPGAIFDYIENARVAALLAADPETLDLHLVAAASHATVLKSMFTTVAMMAVLALIAGWIHIWWRARSPRAGK